MASKVKIFLVGFSLIALAGSALAAGPGYGSGRDINCPAWGNRLNLTPEQTTKLQELREKNWKETISLRNEMQTKRLELRTLWTAPNPDKDKILAKQKELNELRDKMQAQITDFRLEIRKALTPEQATQLGNLSSGFGFHRGFGRPGMWRQGPCGSFGRGAGYRGSFGPGAGPSTSQTQS